MNAVYLVSTLIFAALVAAIIYMRQQRREEKPSAKEEKPQVNPKEERLEKARQKEAMKQKAREEKRAKNQKAVPQPMESAEQSVFVGNTNPTSFSFSDDGKYFIVSCMNRNNLLFDISALETKKNSLQRFKLVDDQVIAVDLINSDNGLEAVCGLDRGRAIQSYILDVKTGKSTEGSFCVKNAAKSSIQQLKVAKDHSYVVTFSDETYVSAFLPNGTSIIRNDSHQMHNYELSCSADSNFFALSSYTSEIVALGTKKGKDGVPVKAVKAFTIAGKNSVVSIDFHPTERRIAIGSLDGHFNIWATPLRWEEGDEFTKLIESYQVEGEEPIKMVRQNPVNDIIAVLTKSEKLYFYNKGKLQKTVQQVHSSQVTQLTWTPKGDYIVALSTGSCFLYAYAPQ